MARKEHLLTTEDNPFNPWTSWDAWYAYDRRHNHHTLAYLARVTFSSHELSEADEALAIEQAMDEIVSEHSGGLYKKVPKPETV